MRDAAVPGYKLSKSKKSTKVLITCAMTAIALGLVSALASTLSHTGIRPESVSLYYLGDVNADEFSDMMSASEAKSFAELAETTHMHVMGGALLLFLLAHLLSVCDVKDSTRTSLYLVTFASFLSTFGLPWVIVYVSPLFSYLYGTSSLILITSLFVLCALPIREMWFSRQQTALVNPIPKFDNTKNAA